MNFLTTNGSPLLAATYLIEYRILTAGEAGVGAEDIAYAEELAGLRFTHGLVQRAVLLTRSTLISSASERDERHHEACETLA